MSKSIENRFELIYPLFKKLLLENVFEDELVRIILDNESDLYFVISKFETNDIQNLKI